MNQKLLCLFLLLPYTVFSQIPLGIGEWRTHVPYRNATSLTNAGNTIYVSANVFFFSYDKDYNNVQRFDKITGLSDVGVSFVSYNPYDSVLLIVYENANIDLLKSNGISNISDIRRKQIIGDKTIYSTYFIEHLAYLSCGFGIVALDLEKKEIKDTYRIGSNGSDKRVFSFTADSLNFYAATEEGLKVADQNSPNLANYNEWSLMDGLPATTIPQVVELENELFANVRDTLFRYDGNSWDYYYSDSVWKIEKVTVSENQLIICESSEALLYEGRVCLADVDSFRYIYDRLINVPLHAELDDNGILWVADLLEGLVRIDDNSALSIFPAGPTSSKVQDMSVERGQLWVVPGGVTPSFNYGFNGDGVFSFINSYWQNYNQYTNSELTGILDIWQVAADPNADRVYFGSWYAGLVEFSNGSFTIYDKDNSILKGRNGDTVRTVIGGVTFDSHGNLWFSNSEAIGERQIVVKTVDGAWMSFQPQGLTGKAITQVIVDDYDQKWFIIPRTANQGILVYNHGLTIEDPNDQDAYKIYGSGAGNGNLPDVVLCLAKDLDGEIWVGTGQGIAVFYCPSAVFSEQGCEAQQIIVTENGVAGYLLETEAVNTIAIDGANRKWVGTNNGVFVLSPDGTEQINYYTIDNSPLLSNSITTIAIDGQSGEVFIGTEKGIVSIRGEATDGGESHTDVLVFPNPVYENYYGPIAIKGLANNANVKITDVNGNLFYQTEALGGQAVWDGRNYNNERAKTGVYLIFSSNEDGSSTNITKLLIIN